jgi:hypothetical protein
MSLGKILEILCADSSVQCSLASFARDLMGTHQSISEHLTEHCQFLEEEQQRLSALVNAARMAKDKLVSELHRVDAQIQEADARIEEIEVSRRYCRIALNAIITGQASEAQVPKTLTPASSGLPVSHSVESSIPAVMPLQKLTNQLSTQPLKEPSSLQREVASNFDVDSLISVLQIPDLKESTLLGSLVPMEQQVALLVNTPWSDDDLSRCHRLITAIIEHIPLPRPPVQILESRILTSLVRRSFSQRPNDGVRKVEDTMVTSGGLEAMIRLLHSVNDEVKCESLECLSHLCASASTRVRFCRCGGLDPLLSIVASSTNEPLLERALVFLWGILSTDDEARKAVRENGGLRSIMDLLYTDSMSILENVAMCVGYITREEASKIAIRDGGGLEKITATLRHPSESIQTKIAGAVWNCASNNENRQFFRQLGCIPALIELLCSPHEYVQENAAGALWNLSVDGENKSQILDYGGIHVLVRLLQQSRSSSVIENVSGTLWNCSAMVENRSAIRKCGGIQPLLSLLSFGNEKIQDNAAGALRNCAINDQNKTAIREAGGIEIAIELMGRVQSGTLEKLVAMLWILTAAPEAKVAVRLCGGIPKLVRLISRVSLSTQEKLAGLLRNCATEAANRQPMIECGCIGELVTLVRSVGEGASTTLKEAVASAFWYLSREDKVSPAKDGALKLMCEFLTDETSAVVEQAAGALSSMTVTNQENRDNVREVGGLEHLLFLITKRCRAVFTEKSPNAQGWTYALLNVLLAVRNCTSTNETNVLVVARFDGAIDALLSIIVKGSEDCAREAALCIKNISIDRSASDELHRKNAVSELVFLGERSNNEQVKKVAALAVQSLTRVSRK